jgi:hypothetical protein
LGLEAFYKVDAGHASSLNVYAGRIINDGVMAAFPDLPHK